MGEKEISTSEWYDFIAELSGQLPAIHMGGENATQELLAMCELDADSHVLDVGCGAGHTACRIAEQVGARVQGIDISEVMIDKAEEKARRRGLADRVQFRLADAFDLPFDADTYDVALLESVLTPLPGDKGVAMREMVRVLRPGGRVCANESIVDASAPPELLAMFAEHPAMHGHFTPETLRDLFERAGLCVTQLVVTKTEDVPNPMKEMGFRGLLSFMVRVYPKILLKLLRDRRFRRASKVDNEMTRLGKPYMGYSLIVGQKPL